MMKPVPELVDVTIWTTLGSALSTTSATSLPELSRRPGTEGTGPSVVGSGLGVGVDAAGD